MSRNKKEKEISVFWAEIDNSLTELLQGFLSTKNEIINFLRIKKTISNFLTHRFPGIPYKYSVSCKKGIIKIEPKDFCTSLTFLAIPESIIRKVHLLKLTEIKYLGNIYTWKNNQLFVTPPNSGEEIVFNFKHLKKTPGQNS